MLMTYQVTKKRPIRFGIICNKITFTTWEANCIRKLLELDFVELSLLIIDENINNTCEGNDTRKLNILWRLYSRFIVKHFSKALKPEDLSETLIRIPAIHCKVHKKGKFSRNFSDADIEKIKEYSLDFILLFGFNIIRGEILKAARYGIWSFHHDDEMKYRGIPPCFWEIYKNDNITGFSLQRLTDRLNGDVVLKKGFLKTIKTSYVSNLENVLIRSTGLPAQVCIDIQNGNDGYINAPPSKTSAPIFRAPNNLQMILFFLKIVRNILRRLYYSVFFYDLWNIGIVDTPIHVFIASEDRPQVRWLTAMPHNKYSADPFGVYRDENLYIFFEEYDYRTSKGFISGKDLKDWSVSSSNEVIHTSVHMSYPYLIEHNGELYCVPEASPSREVSLYKVAKFPYAWTKVCTLINNVAAVDSTIFFHNGYWWLMATDGALNEYDNLNIWYANDLLGPWKPHASNPVKVDISSARPAGTLFVYNGQLYRPSQDCSDHYGKQIVLNRIIRLTPTEFEEERAAVVEPYADSQYPDGLHTISTAGNKTLIDGKKRAFIGANLSVLKHKIRKGI